MFSVALTILSLLSFAMAEGTSASSFDNSLNWKYGSGGGLIGFIVLILDIIVLIEVLKSNRLVSHKLLWCVIVFVFPIIGLILYYLFSNRDAHNGRADYTAMP